MMCAAIDFLELRAVVLMAGWKVVVWRLPMTVA
jgi:hypothetical protein